MRVLIQLLPHILTLINLGAGCVACIALISGRLDWVPWCLLISAVADFFDGFAARAANVSGPFGRELDSLADVVSFGVSPALMAFVMLAQPLDISQPIPVYAFGALLIALLSAVRLARFNIDQADTKHFIGLATPASTVFWFGLFQVWRFDTLGFRENLSNPVVLLPIVLIFSYLLVSKLPLFSNKLDPRRSQNWPVWVVLLAMLVLPWMLGWAALPIVMTLYVLSGLIWQPPNSAH